MTKKETMDLLNDLTASEDPEESHMLADDAVCAVLRELGHADLADAWERARNRCGFCYSY